MQVPSISQCILVSTFIQICEIVAQFNKKKIEFTWSGIDDWSPCSQTCGVGSQEMKVICLKSEKYSESIVADEFCKSLKKPNPIIRTCNFGNCDKVYFWRPNSWSECSQTCGNAGRRTREIDCMYNEGEHVMELSNDEYCDPNLRPQASSSCNLLNCPPVFVTGSWGKCVKSRECMLGKKGRSLDCIVLLKSGKPKKVSKTPCYSKYLPPPSWKICYDFINTKNCLKSTVRLPEIETKNDTFIQMRRSKKLKLQIGQDAFVLLYSKIVLRCTVNHFVAKDIVWKHKSNIYKFIENNKNRIRVDPRGRIRISKFNVDDQGIWTCIAGPVNASSVINFRNPSVGYHDWVLRSTLWNKEMLNEAPQTRVSRNEVIQWIIGSWSSCSVTCGGEGIQTRDVHCEEIDTRHYSILSDDICEKLGQKKADAKRSCLRPSMCPKWVLTDFDRNQCTDVCLRIGVAKVKGNLICSYQEKEIDMNHCDKETMPRVGCSNEKCQVTWKLSKWSKCSLSCGGLGIMARYVSCVWRNTGLPAGFLCYHQHLIVPRVIKTCLVPRCNLKCMDLYTNCYKQERFCKLSIYRYMCCSTCKKAIMKMKIQSMENIFQNRQTTTANILQNEIILNTKSAKPLRPTRVQFFETRKPKKISITDTTSYRTISTFMSPTANDIITFEYKSSTYKFSTKTKTISTTAINVTNLDKTKNNILSNLESETLSDISTHQNEKPITNMTKLNNTANNNSKDGIH